MILRFNKVAFTISVQSSTSQSIALDYSWHYVPNQSKGTPMLLSPFLYRPYCSFISNEATHPRLQFPAASIVPVRNLW